MRLCGRKLAEGMLVEWTADEVCFERWFSLGDGGSTGFGISVNNFMADGCAFFGVTAELVDDSKEGHEGFVDKLAECMLFLLSGNLPLGRDSNPELVISNAESVQTPRVIR